MKSDWLPSWEDWKSILWALGFGLLIGGLAKVIVHNLFGG